MVATREDLFEVRVWMPTGAGGIQDTELLTTLLLRRVPGDGEVLRFGTPGADPEKDRIFRVHEVITIVGRSASETFDLIVAECPQSVDQVLHRPAQAGGLVPPAPPEAASQTTPRARHGPQRRTPH